MQCEPTPTQSPTSTGNRKPIVYGSVCSGIEARHSDCVCCELLYSETRQFTTLVSGMVRKEWQDGKKHCTSCDVWRPPSEFHRNKRKWDGYHAFCKECMSRSASLRYVEKREAILEQGRRYRRENQESRKDTRLKSRFGITLVEYERMLSAQDGRCAICKASDRRLCVDHCHGSGNVRGLLCRDCNAGLGMFRDSEDNLAAAIKYLGAV